MPQRRRFLSHLSRSAALLAWQQLFAPQVHAQLADMASWTSSQALFTLGVASGEPRSDSVVLWTRLAPHPLQPDGGMPQGRIPVSWEVAADPHFNEIARSGRALAVPDSVHSVHVDVTGLQPGQTYYYRFEAGGQRSPVGRTRTAPEAGASVDRLRVALASCQHYEAGYFAAHRDIARADVDLVVFIGDYIYESEQPPFKRVRMHPHPFNNFDLTDYRLHHSTYKLDADLRACHAAHPWLLIWDDHEVLNDYTNSTAPDEMHPEVFLRYRAAAYKAYFEHLPVSPSRAPVGPNMRMYERYEWGRLAEFWTLDGRQYRDPHVCTGVHAPQDRRMLWRCEAAKDPARTLLGQHQEDWLAEGLAASSRDWKLIVQPTQLAQGSIHTPMGSLIYADGWDAYPAARERLMMAIAQPRVPGVICLGGDVHRNVAANLRVNPLDHHSPIVATEFVVTSVTSSGLSELVNGWMKASNPDLLYSRSDERGYAVLDITPRRVVCEFMGTPHPVRLDARFHLQARYQVDRGVPGPRKT